MFPKNFPTSNQVPVNTESISTYQSYKWKYSHGMNESTPIISHFPPMYFAKPSLCESRDLNFWTPYCGTRPRRCGMYGRTRQSAFINSKVPAKFSQKAGTE